MSDLHWQDVLLMTSSDLHKDWSEHFLVRGHSLCLLQTQNMSFGNNMTEEYLPRLPIKVLLLIRNNISGISRDRLIIHPMIWVSLCFLIVFVIVQVKNFLPGDLETSTNTPKAHQVSKCSMHTYIKSDLDN